MKAEFYIIPESFINNSQLSVDEIESKLKSLALDFAQIRLFKYENILLINPQIYDVIFIDGYTISDLLNNSPDANRILDRDIRVFLKTIVWESGATDKSLDDITILLPAHNETICYGLICFNAMNNITLEYQIIYCYNDWLKFRRYFLQIYPQNNEYFIDECKKYFPNLFFHERTKNTIDEILNAYASKIIYHLSALNDKFREFQRGNCNRREILRNFSIATRLDEHATLEGNSAHKSRFTFLFLNNIYEEESVCCEPHLKLCYGDQSGQSYTNDVRIYFHEGKPHIQDGKILIGHIGNHL